MSLDHRIKKGLQSPTIKVDLALVMVVVRDDHNKFISKCNHVRRNRNSHRPARYLTVFLVCEHHPALRLAICEVPLPIPPGVFGREHSVAARPLPKTMPRK